MAKQLTIALIVALSLFHLRPCRAEVGPMESVQTLRQAKSEAEMDQAIEDFSRSNVRLVDDLVAFLQETKTQETKTRVCFLLGEMRNPRSTRPLIENILVKAEVPETYTKEPLWGANPCQEALAKIGKPAEWQLIEILTGNEREEVKAAALKVIQKIEGWRGAVFVLEQSWEKAALDKREELGKALERARKHPGN